MSASTFHFSPRPNRAAEIRWRAWDDDAFRAAQAEDKPILLGISAVWCHWCHVMDETSYSDDQVIQLLNDRFITIRVDNDQRPDINARYNAGGWPTTAFLTPGGEVMAAMTYVPPEQMRDVLQQVSGYYKDNKQTIDERIAQIMQSRDEAMRSASGSEDALSDQILRDVLHTCADAYDPVFGGFGNEPKFPHTDAIDLLLHAYLRDDDRDALHMARKTMDYMCRGGTYDQEWGGCYRYSTKRDWSVPHYEKMLEDNALLLRNLLKLYRITGDELHRRYIDFTIAYLDTWLSDAETGVFYGSQDADEEFYPPAGRGAQKLAGAVRRPDAVHELERDGRRRIRRSVVDVRQAGVAVPCADYAGLPVGAAVRGERRDAPVFGRRRAARRGIAGRPGVDARCTDRRAPGGAARC